VVHPGCCTPLLYGPVVPPGWMSDVHATIGGMADTSITTREDIMTLINVFTVEPDRQQELPIRLLTC
jgi:hypothetical protein